MTSRYSSCIDMSSFQGSQRQNGRHERMHLTLKKTKPAGSNFLQQQARFDDFIGIFNEERPHEALEMKYPAEVYQPVTRVYQGLPDIDYPFTTRSSSSRAAAESAWAARKLISARSLPAKPLASSSRRHLAGQLYGLSFGVFRSRHASARTAREPVRSEVVTYVAGMLWYPCVRVGPRLGMAEEEGFEPMLVSGRRRVGECWYVSCFQCESSN